MLQQYGIVPADDGDTSAGAEAVNAESTSTTEAASTSSTPAAEATEPPASTTPTTEATEPLREAVPESTTIPLAAETVNIINVPAATWYTTSVEGIATTSFLAPLLSPSDASQHTNAVLFHPEGLIREREFQRILTNVNSIDTTHLSAPKEETAATAEMQHAIERAQKRMAETPTLPPNGPLTRGQAIQQLMGDLGIPLTSRHSPFSDLLLSSPYAPSIAEAARLGIIIGDTDTNGVPVGTVRPNEPINHAEMATILDRLRKLGLLNEKAAPPQENPVKER
ncbi:MAG: S-layer homology domain-containing protein [Candidatus Peribacteraceae bacterium]|nr:S-layer homology domain-containing protein [Candidatus Peribacteraceae bacterium]